MSVSIPPLFSKFVLAILLLNLGGLFWPRTVQAESSPTSPTESNPAKSQETPVQSPQTIAQTPSTVTSQCYWSTLQMGVYQEPNPFSTALGIVPAGAIVFIGPGSGQGWVRLQAPLVGWMTATGLQANPLKDCNGLGTIVPVEGSGVSNGNSNPASGTIALGTPSGTGGSAPVPNTPILCTVTAPSGLAVRNQPILHPRTLTAILEPGLHRFEFSDRQVRLESSNQVRDWFYITAPVTGWISPRVVDNPSVELTGEGCF
jgi:hypothetical protein